MFYQLYAVRDELGECVRFSFLDFQGKLKRFGC